MAVKESSDELNPSVVVPQRTVATTTRRGMRVTILHLRSRRLGLDTCR